MKFRAVRLMLREAGFEIVVQEGSHEQWKHPDRPGRVTVAGTDSAEVKPGTLNSILKQAGLKKTR
jgi:predicted RNA binding protein YcfA (HicA-like mRNA interferase family)